jgi:AP-1-like factor
MEELEQRNQYLERCSSEIVGENHRLKEQLHKIMKSQEIINNAKHSEPCTSTPNSSTTSSSHESYFTDFSQSDGTKDENTHIPVLETKYADEQVLNPAMTWDLIQDHWLYRCGYVRIEDIYLKLNGSAKRRNSLTSNYSRADILEAIESSATGKYHDLL